MMSVEATMEVRVPMGSTWRTPHAVQITNKLATVAVLSRVLSERKTLAEYAVIGLASTMFHCESGWVRVEGDWVHWDRNDAKDRILLAFLDVPKEAGGGNSR